MKGIQLDLTGCKGYYELHERIRQAFNFPNFYGHNWSAFWDFLWSECDADRVKITGEGTLPGFCPGILKKTLPSCTKFWSEKLNFASSSILLRFCTG